MGFCPRYDPKAWERRTAIDERAKELDPEAFKPLAHVPYYSPDQEWRMYQAMHRAASEFDASPDHPQA